jgi:hypothetical protein
MMEIHENFEEGFERNETDHDPFQRVTVAALLTAFQRLDTLAVVV